MRHVWASLWRFFWFRYACLFLVEHGFLVEAITHGTPFGVAMREMSLRDGDFKSAREWSAILEGRRVR